MLKVSYRITTSLLIAIKQMILQIDKAGDKVLLSDNYQVNLTINTRCKEEK